MPHRVCDRECGRGRLDIPHRVCDRECGRGGLDMPHRVGDRLEFVLHSPGAACHAQVLAPHDGDDEARDPLLVPHRALGVTVPRVVLKQISALIRALVAVQNAHRYPPRSRGIPGGPGCYSGRPGAVPASFVPVSRSTALRTNLRRS